MGITLNTQAAFRPVQNRSFCYVCARTFLPEDERTRDHVPPSALFSPADRQPALILPTHSVCNHNRSAQDEVVSQLVGVLHGRAMSGHGRRPTVRGASFPDGSQGVGITDVALKPIIFLWVTGFHAALYNEPLGPSGYLVFPPLAECRVQGTELHEVPVPDVVPHLVEELKRNRATGTLDVVESGNGQCRYECVWSQADDGRRFCVWSLDLYGWKNLGDITHFEPRGCLGAYHPHNGIIPAAAAIGTRLEFAVPNNERLDPFGS